MIVFNQLTLDGFFADPSGDMSWAHKQDAEWTAFTSENASGGGCLLFGRVTYEMMLRFWPTAEARAAAPVVAERMNGLPKVVFSRTLDRATWNNTKLIKSNLVAEVSKLKEEPGPDLVLMGSGSIVTQLADVGLIDQYQLALNPVALTQGRSFFSGMRKRLNLKLTQSRTFENGNVFVCYEPA